MVSQANGDDSTPVWLGVYMKNNGDGSFACKTADGGDCPSDMLNLYQNQADNSETPIYGTQLISGKWNVVDCAERVYSVACKTTCDQ
nr:unnamed protein product [Meloidogyne enterolobii]